jgi:Tol biopolymer transport system component
LKADAGSVELRGFTPAGSLYFANRIYQRDVYTADLDPATGKVVSDPRRVSESYIGLNTGPVRWSPDGRLLAFIRRRPNNTTLVIHTVSTGEEREVPGVQPQLVSLGDYLSWFPDSRSLLVAGPGGGEGSGPVFRQVDVETGKAQATFQIPPGLLGHSSRLSQDGKMLFYARRETCGSNCTVLQLVGRNLQSGAERELYLTKSAANLFLALSADGRQLAVLTVGSTERDAWSLVIVPVEGGTAREARTLRQKFGSIHSHAWTADGRHVLVASSDSQLWSYPADGSEPQPTGLKMDELTGPSVSPNGRQIAFVAGGSRDELWEIRNVLAGADIK